MAYKEEKKKLPVKTIRAGGIKATIWENEVKDGKFNSIVLSRSYKDKEDKWQETESLRVQDIPKATLVLNEAYKFLSLGVEKDD